MRDWNNEQIIVRNRRGFKIYLTRTKITKVTEKSVFVEYYDELFKKKESLRLSKEKLEKHSQFFVTRSIRFMLLSKMTKDIQERMKGVNEIIET